MLRYVISVEKECKKSYVSIDQTTGKGMPVDDPKAATILPNKVVAKAVLTAVRPVIEEFDPGVKVKIEGVLLG